MLLLLILFRIATAKLPDLYPENSSVVTLTDENFNELVVNNQDVWIVQFYSPSCIYCRDFAEEYIKTAEVLQGVVKTGVVNIDVNAGLGDQYMIKAYPTVLFFIEDKNNPETYTGNRTSLRLIEAAFRKLKKRLQLRLGNKFSEAVGKKGMRNCVTVSVVLSVSVSLYYI